jgi:hypothetical protein
VVTSLTGANRSTQYVAVIGYDSLLGRQQDSIKIEIGLREPLLTPMFDEEARTALLDPVSGQPMIPHVALPCISQMEAFCGEVPGSLVPP